LFISTVERTNGLIPESNENFSKGERLLAEPIPEATPPDNCDHTYHGIAVTSDQMSKINNA